MPATVKRGRRKAPACPCGCGQAPADTTRLRKLECPGCGYTVRITREWIGRGVPSCPCGGALEPVCLFDRVHLPEDQGGRDAYAEASHLVTSELQAPRHLGWEHRHSCPDCMRFRAAGSGTCRSCGSSSAAVPTHEIQTSAAQKRRSARRRARSTPDMPF